MSDADERSSRVLAQRMWRDYLAARWPKMLAAAVVMIIEGSTLGLLSWMLKPLFDQVFVERDTMAIWWVGGAILSLFLIRAVTSLLNRGLIASVSFGVATQMQTDLLTHVMTLDDRFFQANPPGALIEHIQGDSAAVQGIWTVFITGAGRDGVSVVALFAVAISIDPIWTAAALIGAPMVILPTMLVQRYVRRKTRDMRARASARATRLDEVIHGIAAVKLNRLESYQKQRFEVIAGRIQNDMVKVNTASGAVPALIDIITGLGFVGVLILGGGQVISGARTIGDFMSFFTAMTLAFQPLRRLGGLAGTWQTAAASLERIYNTLDARSAILPGTRRAPPPSSRIVFDGVWLDYSGHPVLQGLSFTAEAGEVTAIVGPSGAGKSTVFNVLTRMIDPSRGLVSLGGVPVHDYDLGTLRDQFSVVSQDAALFDESLRENIVLGREVTGEALRRAVTAAHVADFADQLPAGLETQAGPRGSALSGGQRQRVAIARAVLRNAPVLLLDEATSALDTASERQVAAALDRLSQARTTVVIAHRLSTIRNADKIVVIEAGRVVEEGDHDSLMARDGVYAALVRLQFAEQEA